MENNTNDDTNQRYSLYGFHFNVVGAEQPLDGCMHIKLKHRNTDAVPGGLWDFQCYAGNLFKQIPELAEIVMTNGIAYSWDSKRDALWKMICGTGLAVDETRLSGSILHFRGNRMKVDALVIALQTWNYALSNAVRPFLNISDRSFDGIVAFAREYKKNIKKEEK